jgi:hypothetical protein
VLAEMLGNWYGGSWGWCCSFAPGVRALRWRSGADQLLRKTKTRKCFALVAGEED